MAKVIKITRDGCFFRTAPDVLKDPEARRQILDLDGHVEAAIEADSEKDTPDRGSA